MRSAFKIILHESKLLYTVPIYKSLPLAVECGLRVIDSVPPFQHTRSENMSFCCRQTAELCIDHAKQSHADCSQCSLSHVHPATSCSVADGLLSSALIMLARIKRTAALAVGIVCILPYPAKLQVDC